MELRNPKKAASLLAEIDKRNRALIDYIREKHPDHPVTQLLVKRYKSEHIYEGLPDNDKNLTSYTSNKEIIGYCLRKKDRPDAVYNDLNMMAFVSIHEMAHMGSFTVGHNAEFWKNFKWLLERAVEIGIYSPVNYRQNPREYCGLHVDHNPLFDG